MIGKNRIKREKSILRIRSSFGKKNNYEILLFKSGKYFYAQLNDLSENKTLFASSSLKLKSELQKNKVNTSSVKASEFVAKDFANKCLEKKITENIALNRTSYKYHGCVKAFYENFNKLIKN